MVSNSLIKLDLGFVLFMLTIIIVVQWHLKQLEPSVSAGVLICHFCLDFGPDFLVYVKQVNHLCISEECF